ncbi:MAG: sigma 54-interacting transcriptional regulator [Kiritimatiellae bacterium]|nr:sigma 54-interacting transcriptional regulator [Kiritimatiellia bacterium]
MEKTKILISYFGYEHDQLAHKIQDRTFLSRFGRNQKTIGFLLKRGVDTIKRTDIWRPSVALASYPDLHFDDYYLLYSGLKGNMQTIFEEVAEDIRLRSPGTRLHLEKMNFNPWRMIEVFKALYRFAEEHAAEFRAQNVDCYVNCNHGTMQIRESLFMLSQEGKFPGMRILPSPWHDNTKRDYLTPEGSYTIDEPEKFNEAYRQLSAETKKRAKNNGLHDGIFIDQGNREFTKLLDRILFVVQRTKEPILFTGPTGSGKTQLAKNIAKIKGLDRNFVHVNCATLSGDPGMIKSELFGHDKGDYTGAEETREGRLQQANGGLLFLDEIAELPKEVQPMLLTAIEDKKFRRPHSQEVIQCDFMLICGTNRDLRTEVAKGNFRRDLLERINTWHFRIPGLADKERPGFAARRKDIGLNCQQVLYIFNEKYEKHLEFAPDALKLFIEYAEADTTEWKGNFREFNSMIFRMATLANGLQITVDDVKREIEYAREEQAAGEIVYTAPAPAAPSPPPPSVVDQSPSRAQPAADMASLPDLDYSPLAKLVPKDKYDNAWPEDLVQLLYVVAVCQRSRTLSEASQRLRTTRKGKAPKGSPGGLSKYLKKFGLSFATVRDFKF